MKTDRRYINLLLLTYERIGDISLVRLLGFRIYQKVGQKRQILFWLLKDKND